MPDAIRRKTLAIGAMLGALGVVMGAFGAHALPGLVAAERLETAREWWATAAQYHLVHAVAIVAIAPLPSSRATRIAEALFTFGVVIFAGTLYAMALGAPRVLGAITPLGGLALIAGWIALAVSARRA